MRMRWSLLNFAVLLGSPDPGMCECDFCRKPVPDGEDAYIFGPVTPEAVPPAPIAEQSRIKVLISSYRDPRCAQTLDNLFKRAKFPERIFVGVVDQRNLERDSFDCLALYCALHAPAPCPYADHIQTIRVDAASAQGPIWARAIGTAMVEPNDEFCMQTDAHMDFRTGYDDLLLKAYTMTGNEYAVLSTYVGNIRQDMNDQADLVIGLPRHEIPFLCGVVHGGHGAVRNAQASAATCQPGPTLTALWGAGLGFAKCHFERTVPYDPELRGLFDGEEFSRAIRAFTHGYDVYTPHRPIVFHDYGGYPGGDVVPMAGWRGASDADDSVKKLKRLQRGEAFDRMGLGKLRTLKEYEEFSGFDLSKRDFGTRNAERMCRHLTYVPYKDDPSRLTSTVPPLPQGFPRTIETIKDPLPTIEQKFVGVSTLRIYQLLRSRLGVKIG
jgi:hypothetical protein